MASELREQTEDGGPDAKAEESSRSTGFPVVPSAQAPLQAQESRYFRLNQRWYREQFALCPFQNGERQRAFFRYEHLAPVFWALTCDTCKVLGEVFHEP